MSRNELEAVVERFLALRKRKEELGEELRELASVIKRAGGGETDRYIAKIDHVPAGMMHIPKTYRIVLTDRPEKAKSAK